jgi:hypothetical protein
MTLLASPRRSAGLLDASKRRGTDTERRLAGPSACVGLLRRGQRAETFAETRVALLFTLLSLANSAVLNLNHGQLIWQRSPRVFVRKAREFQSF